MPKLATVPREPLSGETLLSDFKAAKEIAAAIGGFKSWRIHGPKKETMVRNFQHDLASQAVLLELDPNGLLADPEEEAAALELAYRAKELDLGRYVGIKTSVITEERSRIVPFVPANIAQDPRQRRFKEGGRGPTNIDSVDITSIHPETGSINIGEGRIADADAPRIESGFWKVYPFDMYGKPAVSFSFE